MDTQQFKDAAELEVRRYFDYYLNNTWPGQLKDIHNFVRGAVEGHNKDDKAHGGVEKKFEKFSWKIVGGMTVANVFLDLLLYGVIHWK